MVTKDITTFNILGTGTSITGDVTCAGNLRLDGIMSGNLNVAGKLIIGKTATLDGNITCNSVEIEGSVRANIEAKDTVCLKANAKLKGDIVTNKIAIESGVVFIGNCKMPEETTIASSEKQ